MKIFRDTAVSLNPADPKAFAGEVLMKRLAADDENVPVHLYRVEFPPGGRTNWHTHSGPQWLFVVEGRIRVQRFGGAAEDLSAGDAVLFSPGEKHWHGAAPGGRGVHLAVNVNATTEWLEPVTDAEAESG